MRHRLVVGAADAGVRLDTFVASSAVALSRSQVRHLIDRGAVTVDGGRRKPGYVVRAGERVEVEVLTPPASRAAPEDLPLEVLYEDDLVIAINKAPGMVVHPAPGRWQGTLVNALLHRWGSLPSREDARPGIVHRLDRETSGVIVIARTTRALEHLARQFHDRTVEKRYLAVVRGVVRGDFVVDAPIGRHPMERKRMSTRARKGRPAVTRVRVLERYASASLVEARPETGRTHQIRVHLAARGHPVVGDAVYGRRRGPVATSSIARHALHASSLTIAHPGTGVRLSFDAPLWNDMRLLIDELRRSDDGRV